MTHHNDNNTAHPTHARRTGYCTATARRRRFLAAQRCEPLAHSGLRDPDAVVISRPLLRQPKSILALFFTAGSAGLTTEELTRAAPYSEEVAEHLRKRLLHEASLIPKPRDLFEDL